MKGATMIAAPVAVRCEEREDGTIILENELQLPMIEGTIPGRLKKWAVEKPDALYLSQGNQLLTYGEAERRRRHLAARLLAFDRVDAQPLMIVADNGIHHALLMLAATSVGIPAAIVSPSYIATGAHPWTKFQRVVDQIDPCLIVADNPDAVQTALGQMATTVSVKSLQDLSWLENAPAAANGTVDLAEKSVTLDSVAKLLFTSGSTGTPKAVPSTQRMMVSNMLGLSTVWPFLNHRSPVSVDWLPWNHTFGGNCCFNITLWFGGHSHIDSGRPTASGTARSVEALKKWRPNLYYNVPVGFEMLLPELEGDPAFAKCFFEGLDFVFNAGAPLPSVLRQRLEIAARAAIGRVPPVVAGWGSTETAPFSTVLYFDQPHANNLGVPMPGTKIKMVPSEGRYELRVQGPNVMPAYWRDTEATAAAFDAEGFYKIGDAAKFAEPGNPAAGLLFDGRVAENFKLVSGTWVNVGALRLAVISAAEKLISDVVVAGEGKHEIGLLIFPNEDACRQLIEAEPAGRTEQDLPSAHPEVQKRIADLLDAYNARQIGSSTRIGRFVIADEPPSANHDEITDKGYINQRRVLSRRALIVERLFAQDTVRTK